MFGNYMRSLDLKNRVVTPAKLRNELGSNFFVTLNYEKILELRNKKQFENYKTKLLESFSSINKREIVRYLFSNTEEVRTDKIGRFTLREDFLEHSSIKKNVVFLGVANKVEIWPKDKYHKYMTKIENDNSIEDIAKQLLEDGVEL